MSCCPTRFMTPIEHRSLSGAAARRPSPRPCATADSRSAAASSRTHGSRAPTSSCSTRPGTRSEPCCTRDELADIMGFAEEHDYLVISDEIYESLDLRWPPARLAGLGIRRRSRADDPDQQPLEDLCDDRLARRLLRGPGRDHPRDAAWSCSSRAVGRPPSCKMRPPVP